LRTLIERLLDKKINFILVGKESSHPTLYAEIDLLTCVDGAVASWQKRTWNGQFHELYHYRYASSLPLRASEDALRVNWCEITVRHEETGKVLFKSAFITNFAISDQNVDKITRSGRARWKNENESHTTLKTQGHNLEHNFGHGDHYLSMILLSLNLLAFLTHTFMQMSDSLYKLIRQDLGARKTFFADVRTLTRYLDFDSWADLMHFLMHFMATRLELDLPPPA